MDDISSNLVPLYNLILTSCRQRNKEAVENLLKSLISLSGRIIPSVGDMRSLSGIALSYLRRNEFDDIQLIFQRLKKEWYEISPSGDGERNRSRKFGNEIRKFSHGFYKVYTEDETIAKRIRSESGTQFDSRFALPNGKYGFEFIIPERLYYKVLMMIHTPPYWYFLQNKRTSQLKLDL